MTGSDLSQIQNRDQMIRFFDGYSTERMEDFEHQRLRRPLVKTHLLELLSGEGARGSQDLQQVFARRGVFLEPLGEGGLFLASDQQHGSVGFVEPLRPRILALYSTAKSDDLDRWVRRLVLDSPEIDHVWLSGRTLGVLWQLVARLTRPHRYTRLVFTHDSIFDIDRGTTEAQDDDEALPASRDEDSEEIVERRATSFRMVDQVGVIQDRLARLQELYAPLYAISQLRFPSAVGRGGHDFYDNGKVTNRSASFREHRERVLFVVRIYERLLLSTEERAWYSIRESAAVPGGFRRIVGAPVVIRFREPLSQAAFDCWIRTTFERKRNRFRLWGHPIRLGPSKVHVYGVDRHLWQPLFLELTTKGCVAIVPDGTCGNTVHRLVTNIQRYIDPGAEAFIGDKRYEELVQESMRETGDVPSS